MEIRQLRYFVEIADRGNITKAAERLRVAQSALSFQLAKLEAELGADLLYRQSRGVALTEVGEALLPYARAILNQVESLSQVAASRTGSPVGKVTMGISPSVCGFLSVPLLRHVGETCPNVRLELTEELTGTLEADLRRGAVDLAILIDHGGLHGIDAKPLASEELKLVARADAGLLDEPINVCDAMALPLMLPKHGQGVRPLLDSVASSLGLHPIEPVAEINSVAILRSMILSGFGSTILTEMAFGSDLEDGTLRSAALDPALYRVLCLCRNAELPPTLAMEAIARAVSTVCAALLAEGIWRCAKPLAGEGRLA